MKLSLTKEQSLHVLKVASYAAASAVISYLISLMTNDPALFGTLTPVVNVMLVAAKKAFEQP